MIQDQLVALEYPGRRRFICTIKTTQMLRPGAEFDKFGRPWRVSHLQQRRSKTMNERPFFVCVDISASRRDAALSQADGMKRPGS